MPPLNPTAGARAARLALYKEIALITIEFTKTKPILAEKMEAESKRGFLCENCSILKSEIFTLKILHYWK